MVRRTHRFSDDPETYDEIKAKGKKTVEDGFAYIEEKLQGTHAVGDSFTAVDGFLIVIYRWGNQLGFDMRVKYPKFTSLVEEGLERDSVKAAFSKEGIKISE